MAHAVSGAPNLRLGMRRWRHDKTQPKGLDLTQPVEPIELRDPRVPPVVDLTDSSGAFDAGDAFGIEIPGYAMRGESPPPEVVAQEAAALLSPPDRSSWAEGLRQNRS